MKKEVDELFERAERDGGLKTPDFIEVIEAEHGFDIIPDYVKERRKRETPREITDALMAIENLVQEDKNDVRNGGKHDEYKAPAAGAKLTDEELDQLLDVLAQLQDEEKAAGLPDGEFANTVANSLFESDFFSEQMLANAEQAGTYTAYDQEQEDSDSDKERRLK
jgi:hypothetical protein